MAKRNGNKTAKKPTEGRDMPLPRTLPEHLKPYDTNNDGVISKDERIAMLRAKQKEKRKEEMEKNREERMQEMKRRNRRP